MKDFVIGEDMAAKPGDSLTFQIAQRPVMAVSMMEQANEVQVLGLVPNAADGARVAIGAGLRAAGSDALRNPQTAYCALLDPQQALETSIALAQLAAHAAALRGQTLQPIPPQDLPTTKPGTVIPGEAIDVGDGKARGTARNGIGVNCQTGVPGQVELTPGIIAVGGMTDPAGREWVVFNIVNGDNQSQAAMPLVAAVVFAETVNDAVIEAAEREKAGGQLQ